MRPSVGRDCVILFLFIELFSDNFGSKLYMKDADMYSNCCVLRRTDRRNI